MIIKLKRFFGIGFKYIGKSDSGVLEAFANFYCDAAAAIREAQQNGRAPVSPPIATAWDGVLGMKFVEACVASSRQNGQWTDATVDLEAPDGD